MLHGRKVALNFSKKTIRWTREMDPTPRLNISILFKGHFELNKSCNLEYITYLKQWRNALLHFFSFDASFCYLFGLISSNKFSSTCFHLPVYHNQSTCIYSLKVFFVRNTRSINTNTPSRASNLLWLKAEKHCFQAELLSTIIYRGSPNFKNGGARLKRKKGYHIFSHFFAPYKSGFLLKMRKKCIFSY